MTGEITLTGRVLAIGGLKEKMLAARRRGISRIILPAGNRHDIDALPADVKNGMEIHPVSTVAEVVKLIFP
jgi:ATP-dependent Lon protease